MPRSEQNHARSSLRNREVTLRMHHNFRKQQRALETRAAAGCDKVDSSYSNHHGHRLMTGQRSSRTQRGIRGIELAVGSQHSRKLRQEDHKHKPTLHNFAT